MFSTSCQYGLQGMLYIAMNSSKDENVGLIEIAENQEIPRHFLSKILQQLVKAGLLESMKGPNGGFKLSKKPEKITLLQIIKAIDGLDVFTQCGIGFKKCSDDHPCPIHHDYKKVRDKVYELFKKKTLKEVIYEAEHGEGIISLNKKL
ncbi:MAG TPA: Rrf2 family transcriptional regulator [Balneolaceae bacterium]|nr:Rrf2 family transcriptional regulator [Balneolaceae bacterium]